MVSPTFLFARGPSQAVYLADAEWRRLSIFSRWLLWERLANQSLVTVYSLRSVHVSTMSRMPIEPSHIWNWYYHNISEPSRFYFWDMARSFKPLRQLTSHFLVNLGFPTGSALERCCSHLLDPIPWARRTWRWRRILTPLGLQLGCASEGIQRQEYAIGSGFRMKSRNNSSVA